MQEFELRVVPTGNNSFDLELYQCAFKRAGERKRPPAVKIGQLGGTPLVQARQAIYYCLKMNDYDPKTLTYKRSSPYILREQSGIELALLFRLLESQQPPEVMTRISAGVMGMGNEEIRYWFAKISYDDRYPSALKALRILLGEREQEEVVEPCSHFLKLWQDTDDLERGEFYLQEYTQAKLRLIELARAARKNMSS